MSVNLAAAFPLPNDSIQAKWCWYTHLYLQNEAERVRDTQFALSDHLVLLWDNAPTMTEEILDLEIEMAEAVQLADELEQGAAWFRLHYLMVLAAWNRKIDV